MAQRHEAADMRRNRPTEVGALQPQLLQTSQAAKRRRNRAGEVHFRPEFRG